MYRKECSPNILGEIFATYMNSAIRSIDNNISWRGQAKHLSPASFRTAIDQLNHLAARRRDDDRLFASHVDRNLHSIAAHSLHSLTVPEALARGAVHAVPQGPDDVRPFGVSVLESHQHFVADFGHKHKASPASGARGSHPRPGGPGVIH